MDKSNATIKSYLSSKNTFDKNDINKSKDFLSEGNNDNNNNDNNNDINDNNNNIEINKEKNKCKLNKTQENEEFLSKVIQNEQNLFIDCEIFLKNICLCEACTNKYNELGFNFLKEKNAFKEWSERKTFDDIINDDKFIEEAKNDNQISLDSVEKSVNDFFKSKEYKQLTCEQQILIRGYIGELSNKLGEYVQTLNHSIITVEDIYNFINKYKDYFEKLKQQ